MYVCILMYIYVFIKQAIVQILYQLFVQNKQQQKFLYNCFIIILARIQRSKQGQFPVGIFLSLYDSSFYTSNIESFLFHYLCLSKNVVQ